MYMEGYKFPNCVKYIWIDNAKLLTRARSTEVGYNINKHLVLDYDPWREMAHLQDLIRISMSWGKVDYHIETR